MPSPAQRAVASMSDSPAPSIDRGQVDLCLADAIDEACKAFGNDPRLLPLLDRIGAFVLEGGKRLRPRLCAASYRIVSGRSEPQGSVWRASASLELFHAFMLVHDDLIDGSTLRRDRPTLSEAIRRDLGGLDGRKRAADLGLLAGDLLCALGHRMLNRSGLDDAALGRANRLVADMLFETGLGEALDVLADDCPLDRLDEAPLVEAYLRKTSRYTVSGPLALGATIAGAPAGICRALSRFGDLLGLGYQIQNDLASLDEDPDFGDHADLDGGKRTYVLWSAYRMLDDDGRRALVAVLADPPSVARRYRLLHLIRASGAIEQCRVRVAAAQREAVAALRESELSPSQRRRFIGLAEAFGLKRRPGPSISTRGHASVLEIS